MLQRNKKTLLQGAETASRSMLRCFKRKLTWTFLGIEIYIVLVANLVESSRGTGRSGIVTSMWRTG